MKKIVSSLMHKYVVLFVIASLMMMTTMPTIAAMTTQTVTPVTVQDVQISSDLVNDELITLSENEMASTNGEFITIAIVGGWATIMFLAKCAVVAGAFAVSVKLIKGQWQLTYQKR